MILRHSVVIQQKTTAPNGEGMNVSTWSTLKTISADVQPKTLTEALVQAFGLTNLQSDAKKMFYPFDTAIKVNMRVVWNSKTFEIRGINEWVEHCEAILIPIQGVGA